MQYAVSWAASESPPCSVEAHSAFLVLRQPSKELRIELYSNVQATLLLCSATIWWTSKYIRKKLLLSRLLCTVLRTVQGAMSPGG